MDHMNDMIEVATAERKEVVMMGDFNCDTLSRTSITKNLTRIMEDFQLTQLISEPTRITDHSQTLIDHCYVSSPQSFFSSGATPLAGSDHLMIYVTRRHNTKGVDSPKFKMIRSFKKCNMDMLTRDLVEAPWAVMDIFSTIDEKWHYWKSLFMSWTHMPL